MTKPRPRPPSQARRSPETRPALGGSLPSPQSTVSRRAFGRVVAGTGAALWGACSAADEREPGELLGEPDGPGLPGASPERAAAPEAPSGMSDALAPVQLGGTGLRVPRLAMGTGTDGWGGSSEQTRLGREAFVRLIRHGAERGARFLDAADSYGSHPFARAALSELPRDSMTVLTKIWFQPGSPLPPTETARPEVERFLRELGTDYLDIVLLHLVTDPAWPDRQARMLDELSELKEAGLVRAVGCSCHSHAALRVAAEHPWTDVVLARINPGHRRMDEDATVEQVADTLRLARHHGKGVIGMKIYGAGQWRTAEQRRASLEYALGEPLVDAMTIGHLSEAELSDSIDNIGSVLASRGG